MDANEAKIKVLKSKGWPDPGVPNLLKLKRTVKIKERESTNEVWTPNTNFLQIDIIGFVEFDVEFSAILIHRVHLIFKI